MKLETLKTAGKTLLQRLKTDKRALALLCAAAVLLVLAAFLQTGKDQAKQPAAHALSPPAAQSDEERLCALLSSIRGAGKTRVMITYSEGAQTVFAAESDRETSVGADGDTRTKAKSDPVILKNENGQSGLAERVIEPKVQGVAVVCAGASNTFVRTQIIAAVSALFAISTNHISVAEMADQEEPS